MEKRKKLMLIIVVFSLLFSYILPSSMNRDINYHSATSQIAYRIIYEKNKEYREYFEVNFFKPGSVYHLYYVLLYPLLKSTFLVIASYYLIYFILWGISSHRILRIKGEEDEIKLLSLMLLSINPGSIFGMAAFMIAQSVMLFALSKVMEYKKKEESVRIILFSLLVIPLIYYLHPISSFLYYVISSLIYGYKRRGFDKKEVLRFLLLFGVLLGVMGILTFNMYKDRIVGKEAKSLVKENMGKISSVEEIIQYIYSSIVVPKILGNTLTLNLLYLFTILLPLFIFFRGEKKERMEKTIAIVLLIVTLIVPDITKYTYHISARVLTMSMFFYILSSNTPKHEEIRKFMVYILLIIILINGVVSANYSSITGFFEKSSKEEIMSNKVNEFLREENATRVFVAINSLDYGTSAEEIDRGYVNSITYLYKSHPVTFKEINPYYEIKLELVGKSLFTTEKDNEVICKAVLSYTEKICKFFDYVVSYNSCEFPLEKVYETGGEDGISVYKC